MPPLALVRTRLMRAVTRTLCALPRERALLALDRLETLGADLQPDAAYPLAWVLFRLGVEESPPESGAEHAAEPQTGAELRRDLAGVSESVCAALNLRLSDLPADAYSTQADARRRLGVSPATMQRLRRRGLVTRRVLDGRGRAVIVVRTALLQLGAARRARNTTRLSQQEKRRVVARALRYRRRLGWSLHRCATRIAQRTGRSVEGVRAVLLASRECDRAFPRRPRRSDARQDAALRLWRLGVSPTALARALRTSPALARRDVSLSRARELSRWASLPALCVPTHPDEDRALAPASVREGLRPLWPLALQGLLAAWEKPAPMHHVAERELAAAQRVLLARAAALARGLDRLHPASGALDEAQTLLRWCSCVHRTLLWSQGRLIVETLSLRLGTPLASLDPAQARAALREALAHAAEVTLQFDPVRGGRLAGQVAFVVDRVGVRLSKPAAPADASLRARPLPANVMRPALPGPHARGWAMLPWDARLGAAPHVRRFLDAPGREDQPLADALRLRFGTHAQRPHTLRELARELGLDAIRVAHLEQRALRRAWDTRSDSIQPGTTPAPTPEPGTAGTGPKSRGR